MKQSLLIPYTVRKGKRKVKGTVAFLRNPYERIIALYKTSWGYRSLSEFLEHETIIPQAELYADADIVTHLDNWQNAVDDYKLKPEENNIDFTKLEISTEYRRWYTQDMIDIVAEIVQPDLDTFGFTF